jgi:hypothetical protein
MPEFREDNDKARRAPGSTTLCSGNQPGQDSCLASRRGSIYLFNLKGLVPSRKALIPGMVPGGCRLRPSRKRGNGPLALGKPVAEKTPLSSDTRRVKQDGYFMQGRRKSRFSNKHIPWGGGIDNNQRSEVLPGFWKPGTTLLSVNVKESSSYASKCEADCLGARKTGHKGKEMPVVTRPK